MPNGDLCIDHSLSLRKTDWEVRPIPIRDAKNFIIKYHYSKGCSHTAVYSHGLFRKGNFSEIMGVALWLPPTRVCAESVNKENWTKVLSLSRLAVKPGCPKNSASFLMTQSIKFIKMEARFVSLVTYADERQGHLGAIYKATNWQYIGKMKGSPTWIDPKTNMQVAVKSTVSRTKQQMIDLGYVNIGTFPKHKFIMHL